MTRQTYITSVPDHCYTESPQMSASSIGLRLYRFTRPCPDICWYAACLMGIKFKIYRSCQLEVKETDRIEALKKELRKVGYVIQRTRTTIPLVWDGETCQPTYEAIDTYEDHRISQCPSHQLPSS